MAIAFECPFGGYWLDEGNAALMSSQNFLAAQQVTGHEGCEASLQIDLNQIHNSSLQALTPKPRTPANSPGKDVKFWKGSMGILNCVQPCSAQETGAEAPRRLRARFKGLGGFVFGVSDEKV